MVRELMRLPTCYGKQVFAVITNKRTLYALANNYSEAEQNVFDYIK